MKHVVVAAVVAAFSASLAHGQPILATAPAAIETSASQQAQQLLQAAASGSAASFLFFVHASNPAAKSAKPLGPHPLDYTAPITSDQWLDVREQLSTLKFHRIEQASATRADLSAYDTNLEGWLKVSVTVQPGPPNAITEVAVSAGAQPSDVPPAPKLAPEPLIVATRGKVDDEVSRDRFSGAVLIARNGRVLFAHAYGLADRDKRTPNTVETQFRFGSMGKMFTAVAIMQLAQVGKLDLTAPIGRYLPDYPNREVAAKVTVNELLTHTGGTGDIFGPEFDAHRLELRDLKDYISLYGTRGPLFEPGTQIAYSNYGFILLGRIVERVSGLSYDDYVQRNIFEPARMTSTGMQPESVRLPRRATGYTTAQGQLMSAAATFPVRGTSAGGGYSTVGDLNRFDDALTSNQLLNSEFFKLLTTSGATTAKGKFYRYDFGGLDSDGRRYFGHAGGAPGMNGELIHFSDNGYTVAILANRDPPSANLIATFIVERLP